MKQFYENVDYEWLTRPSGDPFVDAGGYALDEFSKHFPNLDVLELIEKATDIYVDRWDAKINPFFLNSKITQPAFKKDEKKIETKKYFLSLLKDENGIQGTCRITGRKTIVFVSGRDNSILSGSRTFVNFHHYFQDGIMLSKEVIIRYFFVPLACEQLKGSISLISSSVPEITKFYSQSVCKKNLTNIALNISDSILKSKSATPETSLFRYADRIIENKKVMFDEVNGSLLLYHFTNFGASPDLNIYNLPFQTLRFYRFVHKGKYVDSWKSFIACHYHLRNASYDDDTGNYVTIEKKEKIEYKKDDYQYWQNSVYDKLLNNKSILADILNYIRKYEFNFDIVKVYQQRIRNMKKETIEKIEQMADFIIDSNDNKGIGRAITKLDAVTSSYLLRRFVLNDIVSKYYEQGNEKAIVTVKDYTDYLFPDTDSWKETRDVLLIAIYERLHDRNIDIK